MSVVGAKSLLIAGSVASQSLANRLKGNMMRMSKFLGFPFVAAMASVALRFLFASSANAGVIVAMGDTEGG